MKKALASFIIVLSLFVGQTKAQDTLMVAAGGEIFNLPATHYYGDTGSYYVYFKNVSSTNFNGTVYYYTVVDTGAGPNVVQTDSAMIFLNPGDSMPVTVIETYDTSNYRVGGNIVVIWPQSTSSVVFINYSNIDTVYILGFLSIGDISGEGFSVFPIPFKNALHIVMDIGEEIPKKIKLRDVVGKLVYEAPYNEAVTFPEEILTGTYFLELQFSDSPSRMIRIMKVK